MKTKRLLACIIAASMAFALCATALAATYDLAAGDVIVNGTTVTGTTIEGEVREDYEDTTPIVITQTGEGSTGNTITIKSEENSSASVTIQGVNIEADQNASREDGPEAGITIDGNVTLTISGENTVKGGADEPAIRVVGGIEVPLPNYGAAGVQVNEGSSLTIRADETNASTINDTLTAVGGRNSAGIGSTTGRVLVPENAPSNAGQLAAYIPKDSGDITIESGTVNAQGGTNAAGIGAGKGGNAGTITITGENTIVNATGGNNGAGIGGGEHLTTVIDRVGIGGDSSVITIDGGAQVNASGGRNAAGIGGGNGGHNGTVTIDGNAVVVASGGERAAGIGGGQHLTTPNEGGSGGDGGVINIEGNAQVNATGGLHGAGIGSGSYGAVPFESDPALDLTPGDGGTINIGEDATVTAIGGFQAAGIGGGTHADGGEITIGGNAKVTAATSQYVYPDDPNATNTSGAGIGGGDFGNGGTILIKDNAVVIATGGINSAGIGGGSAERIQSMSDRTQILGNRHGNGGNITIQDNVTVTAYGGESGAGIGGGVFGEGGTISLLGNANVYAVAGYMASAIGGGRALTYNGITYGDGGVIRIEDGVNLLAFADGAKMAIDLQNSDVSGVNVLNGRFMNGVLNLGEATQFEVVDANGDVIATFALPTYLLDNANLNYRSFALDVDMLTTTPVSGENTVTYALRNSDNLYGNLSTDYLEYYAAALEQNRTDEYVLPVGGMLNADEIDFFVEPPTPPNVPDEIPLGTPEEIPLGVPGTGSETTDAIALIVLALMATMVALGLSIDQLRRRASKR